LAVVFLEWVKILIWMWISLDVFKQWIFFCFHVIFQIKLICESKTIKTSGNLRCELQLVGKLMESFWNKSEQRLILYDENVMKPKITQLHKKSLYKTRCVEKLLNQSTPQEITSVFESQVARNWSYISYYVQFFSNMWI
jgi:hypothetical protein